MLWYGLDPLYFIMVGPILLLTLFAQGYVKSTVKKYSKIMNSKGYTGADVAREILKANGIHDVDVSSTTGWLSDHYDPLKKVIRLSQDNYSGRSIAAVGIAAHEAGHALQHAHGYLPLKLRHSLVPAANLGSKMAFPMIFLGMLLGMVGLAKIGVIVFAFAVIFHFVTLPVEFNASSRALAMINQYGIVTTQEARGARAVLNSAAMTYVASAAAALMQLLYFALRVYGGRD